MLFDPSDHEEDSEHEYGLAALDLLELPVVQYRIMRLMLRHVELDYAQLVEVIKTQPEAEQMTRAELDDALHKLTEQHWLVAGTDKQPTRYKVNFRRKIGNVRTTFTPRSKRGSLLPSGIWDALDAKPKQKRLSLENDDENNSPGKP